MRLLQYFSTMSRCNKCLTHGFFIHKNSVLHENVYSCPFCKNCKDTYINDNLIYCPSCKVLFEPGCIHDKNDDIWNAHVISKFMYQDKIYDGMPQFENFEELLQTKKDVHILEMTCLHDAYKCFDSKQYNCKMTKIPRTKPPTELNICFNKDDDDW